MVQRLPAHQARSASESLAAAFQDDTTMRLVSDDPAKRLQMASWMMGVIVSYGLRWGEVWANDDASAVSVWGPPGAGEPGLARLLRVGFGRLPLKAGLSGSARLMSAMSATEPFHKTVHGPHWYLMAIGTRPERQGQGLGGALVEVGTSRADEAGLPCYLETGTQENIDFYSKRGFEIIGQTPVHGYTITGMVRPPRKG